MSTLDVRIPDELHCKIRRLANSRNRSLSAEVISLLNLAVQQQEIHADRNRLLTEISRGRFRPPRGAPDSVELLREDRGRFARDA